jgi:hypothetical protein
VLVDDGIAGALASTSGFETSALRRRSLRGIGPVTPWVLRRADQPGRRGMMGDALGGNSGPGHHVRDDEPDHVMSAHGDQDGADGKAEETGNDE